MLYRFASLACIFCLAMSGAIGLAQEPPRRDFIREVPDHWEVYTGSMGHIYQYTYFGDIYRHEIVSFNTATNESGFEKSQKGLVFQSSRNYLGMSLYSRYTNTSTDISQDYWCGLKVSRALLTRSHVIASVRYQVYPFGPDKFGEVSLNIETEAGMRIIGEAGPMASLCIGRRDFFDGGFADDTEYFVGAGVGFGFFQFEDLVEFKTAEIEKNNFEIARELGTMEAWQDYLSIHPDARRASTAKQEIAKIEAGRREQQIRERWAAARSSGDLNEIAVFLEQFPKHSLAREAEALRDRLLDEAEWTRACEGNTPAHYLEYLRGIRTDTHRVDAYKILESSSDEAAAGVRQRIESIRRGDSGNAILFIVDVIQHEGAPFAVYKDHQRRILSLNPRGHSANHAPGVDTPLLPFLEPGEGILLYASLESLTIDTKEMKDLLLAVFDAVQPPDFGLEVEKLVYLSPQNGDQFKKRKTLATFCDQNASLANRTPISTLIDIASSIDELRMGERISMNLRALGALQESSAVDAIAPYLASDDPPLRKDAVWALYQISSRSALAELAGSAARSPENDLEELVLGTVLDEAAKRNDTSTMRYLLGQSPGLATSSAAGGRFLKEIVDGGDVDELKILAETGLPLSELVPDKIPNRALSVGGVYQGGRIPFADEVVVQSWTRSNGRLQRAWYRFEGRFAVEEPGGDVFSNGGIRVHDGSEGRVTSVGVSLRIRAVHPEAVSVKGFVMTLDRDGRIAVLEQITAVVSAPSSDISEWTVSVEGPQGTGSRRVRNDLQ